MEVPIESDPAGSYVLGKRKRIPDHNEPAVAHVQQFPTAGTVVEEKDASHHTWKRPRLEASDDVVTGSLTIPGGEAFATILPPEVLQHIFSYVDPVSLGRLLAVNRLFCALLYPGKSLPISDRDGSLRLLNQNLIWSNARRAFSTASPRPMVDMTELEMWKLIRGVACQRCGRKSKGKAPSIASSPWSSGPGPDGVRTIWPFRTRICGSCLESTLMKVFVFHLALYCYTDFD